MFEPFRNTPDTPFSEGQPPVYPAKPNGGFLKKLPRYILLGLAVILVLAVAGTCWYTVDDKQQAVVTTFGKVTDITDAGFHFKLPLGIQHVEKVDVNVYQKLELGYRTVGSSADNFDIIESETKMITGDYNIVNVEFFVEYKVSNPEQYLYGSYEPETILRSLLQSQVRNVVGSEAVDSVLTTGKESIQMRVKELVTEVLQTYDIGLTLVDVKIQDSDPPTDEVTEAFKAVETAKQQAETVRNEARAYQNAQLPQADAQADELLRNAEYLKQNRINEATEQVAMFNAMYAEYIQNPEITKSRMYYEAISEALPDVKVYIDASGDGSVSKVLPLESFVQDGTKAPAAQTGAPSEEGEN
ncbi:MAG: FtsH protease activity modulator HflK [Hominenteromicrobium sp.]